MSATVNIDIMRSQQDTARLYKWDVFLSGPGPDMKTSTLVFVVFPSTSLVLLLGIQLTSLSMKTSAMMPWLAFGHGDRNNLTPVVVFKRIRLATKVQLIFSFLIYKMPLLKLGSCMEQCSLM